MGIEPTALAWEARVLPLYDARAGRYSTTLVLLLTTAARSAYVHYPVRAAAWIRQVPSVAPPRAGCRRSQTAACCAITADIGG